MQRTLAEWCLASVVAVTIAGCSEKEPAKPAAPAPSASAVVEKEPAEAPPGRCSAKGGAPMELRKVVGDVFGFQGDATQLYYTSWDIYGHRGELGAIRKDGHGSSQMVSLDLEPRGLAVDDAQIYYTAGIRLHAIPSAGGVARTLDPQFSSQAIALHGAEVFGVPADYGPYNRIASRPKTGGETKELASSKRPAGTAPNGFSAVAVDDAGVYVTDSGTGRVLRYGLDGKGMRVLASGQPKAFAIALTATTVYFTLGDRGDLMSVGRDGGATKKLGSGLASRSPIAADDRAVYVVLAGKTPDDPQAIAGVSADGGEVKPVATVPGGEPVQTLAVDADCVYWAQRQSAAATLIYARAR